MSEHERVGEWMRRIMQPGETLAPRYDMKMCVVVSSDVIDLIDALEAELEAMERGIDHAWHIMAKARLASSQQEANHILDAAAQQEERDA